MAQKYHILKEYANGVMDEKGKFFPFIIQANTKAAKAGVRYYLKTVQLSSGKAGASAASTENVAVVQRGTTKTLTFMYLPETFAASNDCMNARLDVGILCDVNKAITCSATNMIITFAEVEEEEGEYSG